MVVVNRSFQSLNVPVSSLVTDAYVFMLHVKVDSPLVVETFILSVMLKIDLKHRKTSSMGLMMTEKRITELELDEMLMSEMMTVD